MPLFKNKWEVPDELIMQLRSRFFDELRSDEDLYHPDDIERVKDNDWFIGRYLLHMEKDVDKAFHMLTESLKYRKDKKVMEYKGHVTNYYLYLAALRKKDLPREYFDARAIFLYNKDKRDHPVDRIVKVSPSIDEVVVRCKTHVKKEETRRQQLQYMLYWIEKGVRAADWGVVSILFDCTDSGVGNVDLEMMRQLFEAFRKYYPWGLGYFLVYNMPWYLSAVWRIIKQWIPQRHVSKISFVDANGLKDFMLEEQLPLCMGGTSTKMYEPKDGFKDGDESE